MGVIVLALVVTKTGRNHRAQGSFHPTQLECAALPAPSSGQKPWLKEVHLPLELRGPLLARSESLVEGNRLHQRPLLEDGLGTPPPQSSTLVWQLATVCQAVHLTLTGGGEAGPKCPVDEARSAKATTGPTSAEASSST